MQKHNSDQKRLNGAFVSLTIGILSTICFFAVAELFACTSHSIEKLFWGVVALLSCISMAWHIHRFFVLFGEAECVSPKTKVIDDQV